MLMSILMLEPTLAPMEIITLMLSKKKNSHFKFDGNVNFNAKVSVNNCDEFFLSLSLTLRRS